MNNCDEKLSWVNALDKAASEQALNLPPVIQKGMGNLMLKNAPGDRKVFLKRRLVPAGNAESNGVEWTVWHEEKDYPVLVASLQEALAPSENRVAFILSVVKGWLLDECTVAEMKELVGDDANAKVA